MTSFVKNICKSLSLLWIYGLEDTIPPKVGGIEQDCTGKLGVFYRKQTHLILGVKREVCNRVLYLLSSQPPLQVFIAKVIHRWVGSVAETSRYLILFNKWYPLIKEDGVQRRVIWFEQVEVYSRYQHVQDIYRNSRTIILANFNRANRLQDRRQLKLQEGILDIVYDRCFFL